MKCTCFSDLPKGVQKRIMLIHPHDYDEWVKSAVPALDDRSVIDAMNKEGGYARVVQFLGKVEGYLS